MESKNQTPKKKIECPYCNKKKPHGHKGCNEHGSLRISIGGG